MTDVPLLVELMAEFYAEAGYALNQHPRDPGLYCPAGGSTDGDGLVD